MIRRTVFILSVLCLLTVGTVSAAEAPQTALNTLRDLSSSVQGSDVVIGVEGTYPILDYTYYDYDPETFVVDLADVDVGLLPKALQVNEGAVREIRVESISRGRNRALAKVEIHKEYLAKCLVSVEGNMLTVRVVGSGEAPTLEVAAAEAPAPTPAPTPEPEPAEALPAPAPEPVGEANRLTGLEVAGDGRTVRVFTDGKAHVKYFALKNPDRIVVDFPGIRRGPIPSFTEGTGNIDRVRVSLFQADPLVTRVVLDLQKAEDQWSVLPQRDHVLVLLGQEAPAEEMADAPEASLRDAEGPAPSEAIETASMDPVPAVEPEGTPIEEIPAKPLMQKEPAAEEQSSLSEVEAGPAESAEMEAVQVSLAPVDGANEREFRGYEDLFIAQDSSSEPVEPGTIVAGGVPLSFQEKTITTQRQYTGEPISLTLKDADVKDVLRFFHDISRLNIVVHPEVSGKVTVDLENVPWDQAMDVILKNNSLDYVYENNLIWVAPAQEISRKFSEQQRLQEEKIKAEDPVTFTVRMSYAKVKELEKLIKRFLTDKGEVFSDKRTNSLIIREVPSKKPTISRMIKALDTPTPQVLIEARIVETNINWSQSFGIVWGGNWFSSVDEYAGNGQVASVDTVHPTGISAGGDGTYTLKSFDNNTTGWPQFGTADFAVATPASSSNGFIDLMLGNLQGSFFLDVRLSAMENTGRGRIISAPRVIAQDNEKASIESGVSIPVSIATADRMSVIFINATLKLEVTPRISADGNINMDVTVTNDSVDYANWITNVSNPPPPPIIKKAAKTSLKVRDGDTVVIGGTFKTTEGVSQQGLPFFSKIPVLGWLFKNRNKSRQNEELLIFLTPKIVR